MRNVIYSLSQSLSYRVIDWYVINAASLQFLANSKNHIDYFDLLLPLHPRFQILAMIIKSIKTCNKNEKIQKKNQYLIHTACDNFSNCLTCNCWLSSVYLVWNHPEKFGDRKNRLYSPTQSPFIPVVNWGPELLKLARKSSGLNICGVGVAWKKESFI